MNEKQFEQMDEWFKKAAEHIDEPYNEESWQQLEPLLDELKPSRKRRFFIWWPFGGSALLIVTLLFVYTYNNFNYNPKNETNAHSIVQKQAQPIIHSKAKALLSADSITKVLKIEPKVTNQEKAAIQHSFATNSAEPRSRKMPLEKRSLKPAKISNKKIKPSFNKNNKSVITNQARKEFLKTNNEKLVAGTNTPQNVSKDFIVEDNHQLKYTQTITANPVPLQEKLTNHSSQKTEVTSERPLPDDLEIAATSVPSANFGISKNQQTNDSTPNTKQLKQSKTWQLTLSPVAGIEWSKTDKHAIGPATFAYGVNVGIGLKRWSFETGIRFTRKIYDAGPENYNPKPGNYYANVDIKKVAATCKVLEIPMLINHHFPAGKNATIIATAGVSHAIMASEVYRYQYYRNSVLYNSNSHYKTGQIVLFSGAAIMVGYKINLNKKLVLYAAPYFQMPLRGVGEGRVNITAMGLQTGLTFTKTTRFGAAKK